MKKYAYPFPIADISSHFLFVSIFSPLSPNYIYMATTKQNSMCLETVDMIIEDVARTELTNNTRSLRRNQINKNFFIFCCDDLITETKIPLFLYINFVVLSTGIINALDIQIISSSAGLPKGGNILGGLWMVSQSTQVRSQGQSI